MQRNSSLEKEVQNETRIREEGGKYEKYSYLCIAYNTIVFYWTHFDYSGHTLYGDVLA